MEKKTGLILLLFISRVVFTSTLNFDNISVKEKKDISQFLYYKLCYHFEGFEKLKSFQVIKDIFYNG